MYADVIRSDESVGQNDFQSGICGEIIWLAFLAAKLWESNQLSNFWRHLVTWILVSISPTANQLIPS